MKLFLLILVLFLYSKNSYAYLDFGFVTIIIQSIVAFAIGFLVRIHFYYKEIKKFFLKISTKYFKKNNNK